MIWKADIVSQGETVAEHEGVTFSSRTFFMIGERENNTVPGFTLYGSDGKPLEMVGGTEVSLEAQKEATICVQGLWVHSQDGLRYGVQAEGGEFVEVGALDDPRLQRQWNLRPLLEGAGYAGTD